MMTASGLTFIAASADYYLKAYDSEAGKLLWRGRLPTGGHATPMSYRVGKEDKQYVVIAVGGHPVLDSDEVAGEYLIAFALPD